jgi:hypothetical protein
MAFELAPYLSGPEADNVGDAAFGLRQSYQSGFDERRQLTIATALPATSKRRAHPP